MSSSHSKFMGHFNNCLPMPRESHVEVTLNVRIGCRRHNNGAVVKAVIFEGLVERSVVYELTRCRCLVRLANVLSSI